MKKKLIVLSGAGVSAESGLRTFRDADGLWEEHDVTQVASPIGWKEDKELVLRFYNDRRRQLLTCQPNRAHHIIAELQEFFDVTVITQNVDNLHEKAGSKDVLHLHGELLKVRSEVDESLIYDWPDDLHSHHTNDQGHSLRPHIVWFGEMVPELETAVNYMDQADFVIIIGTSLQVYPAASLIDFAPTEAQVFYVDRDPVGTEHLYRDIKVVAQPATLGMEAIWDELITLS